MGNYRVSKAESLRMRAFDKKVEAAEAKKVKAEAKKAKAVAPAPTRRSTDAASWNFAAFRNGAAIRLL